VETFDAITGRRAVKRFDPDHRLSAAEVDRLLSLALLSPTAFNVQNWRFVIVRDPELRRQIRAAAWNQPQVTEASLFVVFCADLQAWNRQPERYWPEVPAETRRAVLAALDGYYRDKPQVQRDEAMRSCALAAQTLMLAAQSMGFDSCPMTGFDFGQVGELINLPADHVLVMAVAIGRGVEQAPPRAGRRALAVVAVSDRF
jgi:nitroreductase